MESKALDKSIMTVPVTLRHHGQTSSHPHTSTAHFVYNGSVRSQTVLCSRVCWAPGTQLAS